MIWPQPDVYAEAIKNMDFAFATDYFYRDISHKNLDLILPAAMNYERYAPFATFGNKVSVRKPVKPLGEAKEDWWIAFQIGALVADPKDFFDGDPVKACDSVLQKWGTTYAEAQKNLPNMTVVKEHRNKNR